jgi:hypothetical protein
MENDQLTLDQYKREQAMKSAASWFTWIGALSILNSGLAINGKAFTFTFGLGLSQIGDAMMSSESPLVDTLGFFISFGFSGLFILLGWLARHWDPAFLIGIIVYALDAIIFVVAQDWLGVGFHAFALFLIIGGYRAYRKTGDSTGVPVQELKEPA